jgi:TetR/AcrR family transcriptional regulator
MVSQTNPVSQPTRESLLEAATRIFQADGFAGARVDEIARQAGANKALIYYHFRSKEGLYEAVLTQLFGPALAEIERLEAQERDPRARLHALYRYFGRRFQETPALPHVMLREVLSGGRALRETGSRALVRVVAFVAAALDQGRAAGTMGAADPVVVHMGMMGPLLLFCASGPMRERLFPQFAPERTPPTLDTMLAHLLAGLDRALAPPTGRPRAAAETTDHETTPARRGAAAARRPRPRVPSGRGPGSHPRRRTRRGD